MTAKNILLLGLNQTVTAVAKHDGSIIWKTELPITLSGDDFVTVLADEEHVYAHTEGRLHCLDLADGQILWSNSLSGYGYGIASLCFPAGATAPDWNAAAEKRSLARQQSSGL